jgi:ribosomal protein S18 acetylase RimI-like enzyme
VSAVSVTPADLIASATAGAPLARFGLRRHAVRMIAAVSLTYRTIDPVADATLVVANHHDACVASFGSDCSYEGAGRYLTWLRGKVEEFPEGCVLAMLGDACVGQMELEVPWGLNTGYVNLYYVMPRFRRLGFGRRMHRYAEQYFRNWEADRIELHVSPTNRPATKFYQTLGYRPVGDEDRGARLIKLAKTLAGNDEC